LASAGNLTLGPRGRRFGGPLDAGAYALNLLDTCEECQSEAAAQQAVFGEVNEVLAVKPERTVDGQLAQEQTQARTKK
jgi:hypothetical protein